ncbi:hypothetical protein KJ632_00555 [Patescibacteria group bacterium]|nr:hypothetical protein [Patescibacteria group bacterium]
MIKKLLATFALTFLLSGTAAAQMMLFVGEGCPHCANVEDYMYENKVEDKIDVAIYEVYYNAENQALYQQKAEEVGYKGGGVPFLIDGGEYALGDAPIIAYFEGKITEPTITTAQANVLGAAPVLDPAPSAEIPEIEEIHLEEAEIDELNGIMEEIEEEPSEKTPIIIYIVLGMIVVIGGVGTIKRFA